MNELVSAIIITYKRPKEILERAIKSVLNQNYENIECIVVNDCPEDIEGELEISKMIESLSSSKINYVLHECNKGANAARNTGLYYSKGQYIAYLDDDDEWLPNKIERQVAIMSMNSRCGIVYCGFVRKCGDTSEYCEPKIVDEDKCLDAILENNFIGPTSFPLLRTKAIKQAGGFDTKLKTCQEYELWIRILKNYIAIGVNEELGYYHYSEDSTFKVFNKFISGNEVVMNKHMDLYRIHKRAYSNKLINMFTFACKRKKTKLAIHYKLRAFQADIGNPNNLMLVIIYKVLERKLKQKIICKEKLSDKNWNNYVS